MKGMKELVVQEGEGMVGVGKVHMEGRRVQCIAGDQVLIMVVRVVQFMTGMMAQHMKSGGVLIMGGTGALSMAGSAADRQFEVQEHEWEEEAFAATSLFVVWKFTFLRCIL